MASTAGSLAKAITVAAMAACASQALANESNVSCGQPTQDGSVRAAVLVDGVLISWSANVFKNETPDQKAQRIRDAAPTTSAKLITHGTSGTIAGGAGNVVKVISAAGSTITARLNFEDTTGEKEVTNFFASIPLSENNGVLSFSGAATGLDDDGAPSVVQVTASGVTATVNPAQGVTAAAIEDSVIAQLTAGGVDCGLADAAELAGMYPGLESDGRILRIDEIDANGLEVQSTDTGTFVDVAGMIDGSINTIPTVSVWGLAVLTLLLLLIAATWISKRRRPILP